MVIEIKIPSPGESITEAQLSAWLTKDGDYVEKDQELAEIESDKATLPLIAPESGQIKFLIQAGETVKIGTVACTINTEAAKPKVNEKTTIVIKQPAAGNQQTVIEEEKLKSNVKKENAETLKISPVARKMMDEEKLTEEDITREIKRIGKKEIEEIIKLRNNKPAVKITEKSRNEERKKMTPLRKKLGERLVAVKNQTAMLTTFNEIDMSVVINMRKKYQSQFEAKYGIKIGYMSFFAKAVVQALKLHPNINSMIDGDEIVTPGYYDIAVAVQTDKGLMAPVLRNTETLSLAEIELGIATLAEKARSARISMEEMTGGTFTITNGGVFGSLLSTPIINPPQSAILGMHNIVERPVAIAGKVEIRPMMYVALSYDHRIIDGKDSVSFLVHVKQFIEDPFKLLFEGEEPEKLLLGISP
jgi:2-oxoglutarate dehydrogenase E2 component (dihydrolipoamide succinyltransferase)